MRSVYDRAILYAVLALIVAVAVVAVATTPYSAHALEANTSYGSIRVDPHVYFLEQDNPVTVKVTGKIFQQGRQNVVITVTDPASHSFDIQAKSARDGKFEASITLDYFSLTGTYYVSAAHSGKRLGQLTFDTVNLDPPAQVPGTTPAQVPGTTPAQVPGTTPAQVPGTRAPEMYPLTVGTDRRSYDAGDVIHVSGEGAPGASIALRALTPSGDTIPIYTVTTDDNGKYSAAVTAGGDAWSKGGTYTVRAELGERTSEAVIFLKDPPVSQSPGPCLDPKWECIADNLSLLIHLVRLTIMLYTVPVVLLSFISFIILLSVLAAAHMRKNRRAATARTRASVATTSVAYRRSKPLAPQSESELLILDTSVVLLAIGYDTDYDKNWGSLLKYLEKNIGRIMIPGAVKREADGKLYGNDTPVRRDAMNMFKRHIKNPKTDRMTLKKIRHAYRQVADDPGSAKARQWLGKKRHDVKKEIGKLYPETRAEQVKALDCLYRNSIKDQDIAAAAITLATAAGRGKNGAFLVSNDGDHTVFADEISRIAGGRLRVIRPEELTDLS